MWLPTRIKRWLKRINSGTPSSTRRIQYLRATALVGTLGLLCFGLIHVLLNTQHASNTEETRKPEPISLETSTSKLDLPELYYHKLEEDNKKLVDDIKAIKESLKASLEENDNTPNIEIEGLKARLDALESQGVARPQIPSGEVPDFEKPEEAPAPQTPRLEKYTLNLSTTPQLKKLKTVDTTIPAGAFAKTVLLSGLDASASMTAASDPRPMLLRIIDPGTLPRKFQSDLKDCHCTAGAFGDLSSERVYARLEKLTCVTRHTGEIIETQVSGYIAGADGKAGIRGIVASKDGQFLARSLMGGVFSGLSNVANPANRRGIGNPFMAGGTGIPPLSMGESFTSGMAQGASSALDRLSQYYIDRAEQLQPVIQVEAGQVVDIVFTEGVLIGGQTGRPELEEHRKSAPQASSLSPLSPQEGT